MNFKTFFDDIINEEKDIGRAYIQNVLTKQTRNFLEKFTKLFYLLECEQSKQDENHWKGEMVSCLMLTLPQFGGGLTKDELYAVFYNNFENDFKQNKNILFPKYNLLSNVNDYIKNKEEIKEKYFSFADDVSNFIFNNYKIKGFEKKNY